MSSDKNKLDQIVADARRASDERDKGYREQALKMYHIFVGAVVANLIIKT